LYKDWEEVGDEMEYSYDFIHYYPYISMAYNEIDNQLDSVLLQVGDAASSLPEKRLNSGFR